MPFPLCSFLSMLADKLNMTPEEAERWIVNLIRNARLDAKIDSKLVRIYMHEPTLGMMSFKCPNISPYLSQKTEASAKAILVLLLYFLWSWSFCGFSGSRGDGQQCSVTLSAGDWEDEKPVFPQPDVDNEHRKENGTQWQKWGNPSTYFALNANI